ncbi:MAG TPA: amidase [Terriglobales bacterium]|nr:amidase [Terriglobales bacterium]
MDTLSNDICWLTITEVSHLLRGKTVSPVELTQLCLDRIERLNPKLNAFITVTAESALDEARAAEREIHKGHWRGPLHGVPIAMKDLFDTAGVRTTAASAVFKDRVPNQDCEVVRRLKSAGAVLLGKLNMHEFAYGGSGIIGFFGPTRNPWSQEHIAGGSSSGSAAAVAAGMCYGALGSDTGGSIRLPADYCGIVGLKPTYGRVSTHGVIPLSWSCDHVGPMTRSVHDAAIMLQAIAGYDPEDPTSIDAPVPDYAATLPATAPLRVGIPRRHFYDDLDPEIETAMAAAISRIGKIAANMRDVELALASDTMVLRAEAYAYHCESVKESSELYQPDTVRRIRSGEAISAVDYMRTRRQMEAHRRTIRRLFDSVDVLITATSPVPPPTIAELLDDMESLRSREILMLRNTRPFNALGLPTISIPCGFTKTALPIGLQITGAPWAEGTVLRAAHAYERQTDWHTRHPELKG